MSRTAATMKSRLGQALAPAVRGGWPLAMAAGAILLLAGSASFAAAAAAAAMVAAGVRATRALEQRHAQALAAVEQRGRAEADRAAELCARAAPVWVRQIETVRSEADQEVGELARVFGELCGKLDRVLGPAGADGGASPEQILSGLERNGRQLERLVGALRELQTSKERIVHEVAAQAATLQESAAEIRQIALNIRIVSLNATIEAARAGAAGKPFGVIVADMRDLAARTAEASDGFSRQTDSLQRTLGSVFAEQQQGDTHALSIRTAEELVQHVVGSSQAMMRQLTQAIAAMEDERRNVRGDVSRALVALQFQDRVSQILSHVTRNLEEMQARIAAGEWHALDEREWLARLASDYSTHEEFTNHATHGAPSAQPGASVTFF